LNIIFMLLVGLPTSQWYIFVLYLKKVCLITMVSIFLWWFLSRFSYVLAFLNIDKPNLKGLKSRFKTRKHLYGFEVFQLFWKMCIGTWEPI
jgi:cellulose synthase/poly-beta-1,6-N-acetylglucosamine synthase-like glycosyltransferase